MLDERWSEEADAIGDALARLLEVESSPARVRSAEAASDGRDRDLEGELAAFGLNDLDLDAELLARIAYEIGGALAAAPIIEAIPARAVLGLTDTAYGFDGPVPAALGKVALFGNDGRVYVDALEGPARRTTAGDFVVQPGAATQTGEPVGGADQANRMRRLAALLESARLVGAGQALLRYGTAYAREREQFGKIIGSYQGVAHRLVDTATQLDGAELLVRKAAFTASEAAGGDGAPAAIFAQMVWPKAVAAAQFAAAAVHQVFGGNGFTMEYDVQLYSRRIRSWAGRRGRPGTDLRAIARTVLEPAARDSLQLLWHYDQGMPLPRWAMEADKLSVPHAR